MSTESAQAEKQSSAASVVALAILTVSIVDFANKARKAKGSSDLLDHTDVIASSTSLFVLLARRWRGKRENAA